MNRIVAGLMALLAATALTACGSRVPQTKTAPAPQSSSQTCVQALEKADDLLALTVKIVGDINDNDQQSFQTHLDDYKQTSSEYKVLRDRCREGVAQPA